MLYMKTDQISSWQREQHSATGEQDDRGGSTSKQNVNEAASESKEASDHHSPCSVTDAADLPYIAIYVRLVGRSIPLGWFRINRSNRILL
jgi:hypothetical protein